MKRPFQPEWASEEENRLAEEWLDSNSDVPIEEYILDHASTKLIEEYARQDEITKGMRFGHEILPDGEIIIYN